jgi:hypothetical protein
MIDEIGVVPQNTMKWSYRPFKGWTLIDGDKILAKFRFSWIIKLKVHGHFGFTEFRVIKNKKDLIVESMDGSEIAKLSITYLGPMEDLITITLADGRIHKLYSYEHKRFDHFDEADKLVMITKFNGRFIVHSTVDVYQPSSVKNNIPMIATLDHILATIIRIQYTMQEGLSALS